VSSTEAGLVEQPPNAEKEAAPERYGLDAMFAPGSVAVIGATSRPGTVGRTVLENLLRGGFQGKVYAVNAKHPEVLGLKAYRSIRDIPGLVDLAVVATPAATVPHLIGDCVESGTKSAVRGRKPVNMAALEHLLVRFSQLVLEQPWIAEIDINPLLASPERLLALDARIVLHGPAVTLDQLPKPAIRPYPLQYVSSWTMKNGNLVTIRPEDEPLMVKFHEMLSDRTVYLRYFCSLSLSRRVAHERLLRICFGDYDREMALVAENKDPHTGESRIIAVGRLNKLHASNEAEAAVLVSDQYHV
jgi:hypothetical protein